MTTRNRDQASHKQNKTVAAAPILGPSPKSYCAHMPGSGIHGRCTRRRPAKYTRLISATARRLVRSDPAYPIAVIFSCALSARIFPFGRPASSSSLARNGSITPALRRPARHRPPLAFADVPCDGVMGAARQLGGVPQRPRQVISLKNVHDLLGRLHSSPPRELAEFGWTPLSQAGEGTPAG